MAGVALSSRLPGRRAVASVGLVRVVVRVPVRAVAVLRLTVRHTVVLVVARVAVRPAVERLGRLLLVVLLLTTLLLLLLSADAAAKLGGGILCRAWPRDGLLRLLVLLLLVTTVVVVLSQYARQDGSALCSLSDLGAATSRSSKQGTHQIARRILLVQAIEARVVVRVALARLRVLLLLVMADGGLEAAVRRRIAAGDALLLELGLLSGSASCITHASRARRRGALHLRLLLLLLLSRLLVLLLLRGEVRRDGILAGTQTTERAESTEMLRVRRRGGTHARAAKGRKGVRGVLLLLAVLLRERLLRVAVSVGRCSGLLLLLGKPVAGEGGRARVHGLLRLRRLLELTERRRGLLGVLGLRLGRSDLLDGRLCLLCKWLLHLLLLLGGRLVQALLRLLRLLLLLLNLLYRCSLLLLWLGVAKEVERAELDADLVEVLCAARHDDDGIAVALHLSRTAAESWWACLLGGCGLLLLLRRGGGGRVDADRRLLRKRLVLRVRSKSARRVKGALLRWSSLRRGSVHVQGAGGVDASSRGGFLCATVLRNIGGARLGASLLSNDSIGPSLADLERSRLAGGLDNGSSGCGSGRRRPWIC